MEIKKYLPFSFGFISGFAVAVLTAVFMSSPKSESPLPDETNQPGFEENMPNGENLTIFPGKGECIKASPAGIEVFQVLDKSVALARTSIYQDGIVVLLINYNDEYYYVL